MTAKQIINAESGGGLTAQPLAMPAVNGTEPSDWMRLPKPKQRLWGMSRTTWNELLDGGKVKSITLRKKHAQRGIKLIFRPSAEAYLKSLLNSEGAK
jgi:hypothetical protein